MYVVARVDVYHCFKITRKSVHIYTKKSSTKEKLIEYYEGIKKRNPTSKVVITTEEKALEAQKKYDDYYDEKERIALGVKPRIAVEELAKRLDDTYAKHFAQEACGRR